MGQSTLLTASITDIASRGIRIFAMLFKLTEHSSFEKVIFLL